MKHIVRQHTFTGNLVLACITGKLAMDKASMGQLQTWKVFKIGSVSRLRYFESSTVGSGYHSLDIE